ERSNNIAGGVQHLPVGSSVSDLAIAGFGWRNDLQAAVRERIALRWSGGRTGGRGNRRRTDPEDGAQLVDRRCASIAIGRQIGARLLILRHRVCRCLIGGGGLRAGGGASGARADRGTCQPSSSTSPSDSGTNPHDQSPIQQE